MSLILTGRRTIICQFKGILINDRQLKLCNRFGLVSLINGISNFAGYLMPKPPL